MEQKRKELIMATKQNAKTEELIPVMIPYVEGEDPEATIIINGRVTKVRKGVEVKVKPSVAKVIKRSNKQVLIARQNQEKLARQKTDL